MWRKMTDEEYTLWKTLKLSLRKQAKESGIAYHRIFRMTHERCEADEDEILLLLTLVRQSTDPTVVGLDAEMKELENKIEDLKKKHEILRQAKMVLLTSIRKDTP